MAALKIALCVLFFIGASFAQVPTTCSFKNYITTAADTGATPAQWNFYFLDQTITNYPPNDGPNAWNSTAYNTANVASWFTGTFPIASQGYPIDYCGYAGVHTIWPNTTAAYGPVLGSWTSVTSLAARITFTIPTSLPYFYSWFAEISADEHLEALALDGVEISGSRSITPGIGNWQQNTNCLNPFNFNTTLAPSSTHTLTAIFRNRDEWAGASISVGWWSCPVPSASPTPTLSSSSVASQSSSPAPSASSTSAASQSSTSAPSASSSPVGGADPYFADEHGHGYFTNDVGPLILCANDHFTMSGYSVKACNNSYLIPSVLLWNKDIPIHPVCQVLHRASEKDFSDVVNNEKYTTLRTELCKVGSFTYLQHFLLIEECGFETVFLEMHSGTCHSGYMSHAAYLQAEQLLKEM